MHNQLKRIIAIVLTLFLIVSLAACGEENDVAKYEELIDSFVSDKLNTFSLEIGESHKPGAAIWLQNGSGKVYSSDESVATITKYGKVTAVGEGTAYIVIKSGSLSDVYRYDVRAVQPEESTAFGSDISYEDMIDSFVPSALNTFSLKVGDEHKPGAALWLQSGQGSVYSSNEAVVTVSSLGKVTAVGEGTAYIVITAGNLFEVCRYDVMAAQDSATQPKEDANTETGTSYEDMIDSFVPSALNTFSLKVGGEHKPGAAIWLQSGKGSVYSSDESVVAISNLGKVTAVGEGTAYVVISAGTLFEVYRYDVTAEHTATTQPSATEPPATQTPVTQPVETTPNGFDTSYEEMIDSFVPNVLNTFSLKIGGEHKPNAAIWLQSGLGSVYSSDESVVAVSNLGKVTAIGEGTAYIVIKSMNLFEVYRYDVTAAG